MAKLGKFEKEDVKRIINAHINKKHLFTPELKNKIRQQAFEQGKSSTKLNSKKRIYFPLLTSLLGVSIACILLLAVIEKPFVEREIMQQEIDNTSLNPHTASVTDLENVNKDLFIYIINSSLKAATALSTNDFQMLKNVLVSDVSIDENKQIVTFHSGETPFIFETKYFPPFKLSDFEIMGYDERKEVDPIIFLRIEGHSYEVMFSKDEGANGEYRIVSFTGNR